MRMWSANHTLEQSMLLDPTVSYCKVLGVRTKLSYILVNFSFFTAKPANVAWGDMSLILLFQDSRQPIRSRSSTACGRHRRRTLTSCTNLEPAVFWMHPVVSGLHSLTTLSGAWSWPILGLPYPSGRWPVERRHDTTHVEPKIFVGQHNSMFQALATNVGFGVATKLKLHSHAAQSNEGTVRMTRLFDNFPRNIRKPTALARVRWHSNQWKTWSTSTPCL